MNDNGPRFSVQFILVAMMIVVWLSMTQRFPMAHSYPRGWLMFYLWFTPDKIFMFSQVHSWPFSIFPPCISMSLCVTRAWKTLFCPTHATMAIVEVVEFYVVSIPQGVQATVLSLEDDVKFI
jgi:hypothetical protein